MYNLHAVAGISAGVLALIGFIPYIVATLKGKNRPNRATWIIWAVVSVILLFSYKSAGATFALWTSVANCIAFGAVLLLLFKYGEGGWNLFDAICLGAAGFALLLWWFFKSPLPALYLSILIDLIGALPTLKKAAQDPQSENRLTWILFWAANTLNLFAVHKWNMAMAAYPVYLFFISGTILFLIVLRSRPKKNSP